VESFLTDSHAIVDQVAAAVRPWRTVARRIGMSAHDVDIYSTAICVDG